jgi:integrase
LKLTSKAVAALELPAGKTDVIHFDDDMVGLGYRLRASARGKVRRTWVTQYRHAGVSRRLLLGSAAVLSAERARALAKTALARVAVGEDPQAARAERRAQGAFTMRSQVDAYLAIKAREIRPKTLREVTRYLINPRYFGLLHRMPVDQIKRKDVAARLVVVARERGDVVAAKARDALSAFFTWTMQQGLLEDAANPVIGTKKPEGNKPRERVLSDDELAAIWRACRDDDHGRIVKLLVLLAARRAEVGGMRWGELDMDKGTWTLPAARSKNARAHTLPLMARARSLIEAVPRMVSRDHLFGERAGGGFTNWGRYKDALDARSGVSGWTLHDIRRTVATGLGHLGVQPHIIEQILNHQSGHRAGVAGTYNRSPYEREVRAALALWADHVRTLAEGGERKVIALTPAVATTI